MVLSQPAERERKTPHVAVRGGGGFEGGERVEGGGAGGGRESEEERDGEGEERGEDEDAAVGGENEMRGIVGRVDAADDKRRGPPGEDRPERGGEEREHG